MTLRVGLVGGTPPLLGSGGLEIQMSQTSRALQAIGVEVHEQFGRPVDLDILHIFGADPASWNNLRNSQLANIPVVLSPVLMFESRVNRVVEPLISRMRLAGSTAATMRRSLMRSAALCIALHHGEKSLISRCYGIPESRIAVVGNGSNATAITPAPYGSTTAGIVAVGTIGERKRQLELVRMWRSTWPPLVLAGSVNSEWAGYSGFQAAVESKVNVSYIGRLPQAELWNLQARSLATISMSAVEGESLALLDSFRLGKPVISYAASHTRMLRTRFGAVHAFRSEAELDAAIRHLSVSPAAAGLIRPPSWEDVALKLKGHYQQVLRQTRVRLQVP